MGFKQNSPTFYRMWRKKSLSCKQLNSRSLRGRYKCYCSLMVGYQRFGGRAASIFRSQVREQGYITTVLRLIRTMHYG